MITTELSPEVATRIKDFAADVGRRITEADGGQRHREGRLLFGEFRNYISPKCVDYGWRIGWREIEGSDLFVAFVLSVSRSRDAHPEGFTDWTDNDTVKAAEKIAVVLRQVEQVAHLEGVELEYSAAFVLSAWAILVGPDRVS